MKRFIFVLLIILLTNNLVYSRSNSETQTEIDKAIQLIDEKNYNEAIKILTDYTIKDPKAIYEVQDLLDRIRVEREKINTLMDELIQAIYDEEDFEKGDQIIREISALDPNPDQLSKLFLRNARDAATFVINRRRFKDLMDQALVHINNKEFELALENYLQCLSFHQDEFDILMAEAGSSDNVQEVSLDAINENIPVNRYYLTLKNSSFSQVESLDNNTNNLIDFIGSIKESVNNIESELLTETLDLDLINSNLQVFYKLPEFTANYQTISNRLNDYNKLFSEITADGLQSNYISYALLTLNGRSDFDEGIFFVLNKIFPEYLDRLITDANQRVQADFNNAYASFQSENFNDSIELFNKFKTELTLLNNFVDPYKLFVSVDSNFNISGRNFILDNYPFLGDSIKGSIIADSYISLANYNLRTEGLSQDNFDTYRENILNIIDSLESSKTVYNNEINNVSNKSVLKYNNYPIWLRSLREDISTTEDDYINRDINLVNSVSSRDYNLIFGFQNEGDISDNAMGDLIKSVALNTDQPEEVDIFFGINNTDERVLTTYNPQIALDELTEIEDDYNSYIDNLGDYISRYSSEKSYIQENVEFSTRLNSVRNTIELARENRALLLTEKERAADKVRLSLESENRVQDILENAQQAFENERFNSARDFIESGKSVSVQAISFSKNDNVINNLIPSLYNLENRIAQEEARIVIRDVRELINRGKSLYLRGSYIEASDIFKDAELRWAETNSDPHPEIPYWLALIQDALDIESGRYLSITEPLYSVLAGYLSFAEKSYREGLNSDNKVNMLKHFAVADSYLVKVLEVRPLNERARYLQLLVLKSKDPEAFKVIFNNDFIRYRNSALQAIENVNYIEENQANGIIAAYERVINDSYLPNPQLSNTIRRTKIERFYKGVSTTNKSAAQIQAEKNLNDEQRNNINESYIRFQDLYRIAEDDQIDQVSRLINLCEVALGFKRLPVDTSNIRESDRLFTIARAELENTNRTEIDRLNSIITQLQNALTLNPENEDIPVVIDEILVMLGEESNFQLSPEDDKIFRQAQKDYINGDYFEARDKIIEILNANNKNKNYPKLKELINRVEIKIKVEIPT